MAQKKIPYNNHNNKRVTEQAVNLGKDLTMNVFIKYHGKTMGPYGVGGFQNMDNTIRREVKNLVLKAAQDNGELPYNIIPSEVMFVFKKAQTPTYAVC